MILKILACLLLFAACGAQELSKQVLVSVAPYKFFVEKIAGNTVTVQLMVPAGASAHTYEPTPKEMISASHADIWFRIGEAFESKAIEAIKSRHPHLKIVDLRDRVSLITDSAHKCHHSNCQDLHIWLSPTMGKIQAETIATALIATYPANAATYKKNLETFLKELDDLNADMAKTLMPVTHRTLMVSHPAYAYFCRDFNFLQLSVEFEGKDPTPQQLTRLLEAGRYHKIQAIFTQPQYNNKGATLVAKELGAKVILLDPYAENYLDNMRTLAKTIAEHMK